MLLSSPAGNAFGADVPKGPCGRTYRAAADLYHRALGRTPEQVEELRAEKKEAWEARKQKFVEYWKEVRRTRGARLLLRPSEETPPSRLWSGLFHEYKPTPSPDRIFGGFNYLNPLFMWRARRLIVPRIVMHPIVFGRTVLRDLRLINPLFYVNLPVRFTTFQLTGVQHSLTPFGFLYHSLARRPTEWATHRYTSQRREPSLMVKLPIGFGFAYLLTSLFDDWFKGKIREKIEAGIQEQAETYDDLIENDVRFAFIKHDLANPKPGEPPLTKEEARKAAYLLLEAHKQYNEYLAGDAKTDSEEERREKRLAFMKILAPHLPHLVERGVQQTEGFYVPEENEGPLSAEQIDRLLDVQDESFVRYHLLSAYVKKDKEELAKIDGAPNAKQRLEEMLADPYKQFLLELHQEGDLTQGELLQELQSDVDWTARMASCEIMGTLPLRRENGQVTDTPLIMLDVQNDALKDIATRAKARKK